VALLLVALLVAELEVQQDFHTNGRNNHGYHQVDLDKDLPSEPNTCMDFRCG
jgi:hypothetical protein